MGKVDLQKLSSGETALVGTVSGVIEVSLLQPMLYCKNATQQGLPLTLNPLILYRGLVMSVTNMAVLTGLQFPLTTAVRRLFNKPELSKAEVVSSSFLGGAISGLACGPMELVMVQQQRFGLSILATPARIVSATGVAGLFRGVSMACGREGMFTAGYLGTGPVLANFIQEQRPDLSPTSAKLLGSIGAGIVSATLSHPIDTIKTCMQGDIERKTYGSVSQTAQTLLKEGGVARMFKGWSWRTTRMICAFYIFNECQNRVPLLLFPGRFD